MSGYDFNNNLFNREPRKMKNPIISNDRVSMKQNPDVDPRAGLKTIDLTYPAGPASGVPIDTTDIHRCLIDTSESHTLIVGGTGSGKSRRVIMQQLLTLIGTNESAIVFDPKGEVFRNTSTVMVENGFQCTVLDLREPATSKGWNPFGWAFDLYKDGGANRDKAIEIVNSIAATVCPVMCDSDPYWESTAQNAICGLGLVALDRAMIPHDVSFKKIFNLSTEIFKDEASMTEFQEEYDHGEIAYMMLAPTLINSEVTRRCILSNIRQHIMPFVQSESIINMLIRNDVDFESIVDGRQIVYIVAPDEKDIYNPIVSIFVKILYEYLLARSYSNPSCGLDNRVNFILDEFASLPPISNMDSMLSAARSRNIRFTLALQSITQLDKIYGRASDSIKGNCTTWIFFSSRDLSTLKEISSLAGDDGSGKPMSTRRLQTLDKDSGEVLVFRDRKIPFISHLKDIADFGIRMDETVQEMIRMDSPGLSPPMDQMHSGKTEMMETIINGLQLYLTISKPDFILDNNDIKNITRMCDYVGFHGGLMDLIKLIELVSKPSRYTTLFDEMQRLGYLSGKTIDDDFKAIVKPIRARLSFLNTTGESE